MDRRPALLRLGLPQLARAILAACLLLGLQARALPDAPAYAAAPDVRALLGAPTCHDDGGTPQAPTRDDACQHCVLCHVTGHAWPILPAPVAVTWTRRGMGQRISFASGQHQSAPRTAPLSLWPRGPPLAA